jgi:hypothetical protein
LGSSRPTLLLWRQRYADLQPHCVERFFSEITRKRLRRGTFRSVPALIATIRTYDREHNKDLHLDRLSFVDLAQDQRCKEALETGH